MIWNHFSTVIQIPNLSWTLITYLDLLASLLITILSHTQVVQACMYVNSFAEQSRWKLTLCTRIIAYTTLKLQAPDKFHETFDVCLPKYYEGCNCATIAIRAIRTIKLCHITTLFSFFRRHTQWMSELTPYSQRAHLNISPWSITEDHNELTRWAHRRLTHSELTANTAWWLIGELVRMISWIVAASFWCELQTHGELTASSQCELQSHGSLTAGSLCESSCEFTVRWLSVLKMNFPWVSIWAPSELAVSSNSSLGVPALWSAYHDNWWII